MCIKSEVEGILCKLATNDHSDEAYLLTSKFWPLWVVVVGERGGSVVECRTPEREVGGSKPIFAVLCP